MCRWYDRPAANSFEPKSVCKPASMLLEPSLCEGPDRLVAGSRPGEDGPAYTCWAWAPSLQVGRERWTSLSLGEGSNRLYFSLSLGQAGPHPVQVFLGGEYKVKVWNLFLFKIRATVAVKGGKNKVDKTFRSERRGRNSFPLLIWLKRERDARYFWFGDTQGMMGSNIREEEKRAWPFDACRVGWVAQGEILCFVNHEKPRDVLGIRYIQRALRTMLGQLKL